MVSFARVIHRIASIGGLAPVAAGTLAAPAYAEDGSGAQGFLEAGIAMLKAGWTRQDREITRELKANGGFGVPLYLFYPRSKVAGENPASIVLPQLLMADSILRELHNS